MNFKLYLLYSNFVCTLLYKYYSIFIVVFSLYLNPRVANFVKFVNASLISTVTFVQPCAQRHHSNHVLLQNNVIVNCITTHNTATQGLHVQPGIYKEVYKELKLEKKENL